MPIYEYACTACGERTEAKQSFADPPLTECPICGGSLRKLYSPVGIVFKGSGFYSTDKKKPSKAASDTKSGSEKTAAEPKSGSKSESKSETKKDPPKKTAEKSA